MLYIIYLLIFAAIICIVLPFSSTRESDTISIIKRERRSMPPQQLFIKLLKPLSIFNLIFLKYFPAMRSSLQRKVSFVRWPLTPADLLSLKEVLAGGGCALVFTFFPKNTIFLPVVALIGLLLPDFILNSKVKARKEDIVRVLPETVDLLSLCVSAGLDFMSSVRWITAKARPNPMIEELKGVLEETKVGRSKLEALREMSKRLNIPEVTSFTRSLIQAERMGTPVEETFSIISDDVRTRRSFRGRREAQLTAMKMLIPLIIFILPIIMIVVAGPVLLQFMKGGFGGMVK